MAHKIQSDIEILTELGCSNVDLLGQGGEANVYVFGGVKIVRLLHSNTSRLDLDNRVALVNSIYNAHYSPSFKTPQVSSTFEINGRLGTIEARFPGEPLNRVISRTSDVKNQENIVLGWLNAAYEIALIELNHSSYGDLAGKHVPSSQSYHEYWQNKLARCLRSRGELYISVDAQSIARAIPEPDQAKLVHLDIFSGNLLWHEDKVSAVLDFGSSTIMGDGRLNSLFAAVFILSEPNLQSIDTTKTVHDWLKNRGLYQWLNPARKMLAAYWSFVPDDGPLDRWCRNILLPDESKLDPNNCL